MARRLAVKRLSAVEIRPGASHQHELHAGRLRVGLGFGNQTVKGTLKVVFYREEGDEPIVDEDRFTLYDARAGNPKRSEWHLYYYSKAFVEAASPGDLLVLYRPGRGDDLHGVVLARGSRRETRFLNALDLSSDAIPEEFLLLEPGSDAAATQQVAGALTLWTDDEAIGADIAAYPEADHPLLSKAIREQAVPLTSEMAGAASDLIRGRVDPWSDPDGYLSAVLEAETRLFYQIEEATSRPALDQLWQSEPDVSDVLDWAMRIHQARRSRRGQSLQLHFSTILRAHRIPFGTQCRTEPGELPDFVVPSCEAYQNVRVPDSRLRMVACKTTSKERWRQILNEANRIPTKYLLTLDRRLTTPTVTQMVAANLRVFLPMDVLEAAYSRHPMRASLGSVAGLLDELTAATM